MWGVTRQFLQFSRGHDLRLGRITANDRHILQDLRIGHKILQKLRNLFPGAADNAQKLDSGKLAVAGSGIIQEDQVAGLLTAQIEAAFQHTLQHIAVTNIGAFQRDSPFARKAVEPQVGHDCCHDRILLQLAAFLHCSAADGHNHVTVHHMTLFIQDNAAVRIAVKGDAQIKVSVHNGVGQGLHVGRAAAVVDVHAIGMIFDDLIFNLERRKKLTTCKIIFKEKETKIT